MTNKIGDGEKGRNSKGIYQRCAYAKSRAWRKVAGFSPSAQAWPIKRQIPDQIPLGQPFWLKSQPPTHSRAELSKQVRRASQSTGIIIKQAADTQNQRDLKPGTIAGDPLFLSWNPKADEQNRSARGVDLLINGVFFVRREKSIVTPGHFSAGLGPSYAPSHWGQCLDRRPMQKPIVHTVRPARKAAGIGRSHSNWRFCLSPKSAGNA